MLWHFVLILLYFQNYVVTSIKYDVIYENTKTQESDLKSEEWMNIDEGKDINIIYKQNEITADADANIIKRTGSSESEGIRTTSKVSHPESVTERYSADNAITEFSHGSEILTENDKLFKTHRRNEKNIVFNITTGIRRTFKQNARVFYEIKMDSGNVTFGYVLYVVNRNDEIDNAIKPLNVIANSRLDNFFIYIYNSSITNINNIFDKLGNNMSLQALLATELFKNKFKDYITNLKTINDIVTTRLDKVLIVLETVVFVKNLIEEIITQIAIKRNPTSPSLRIKIILYECLDKLFYEENKYICEEFSVCRATVTFRTFFSDFIDIIIKGGDDKIVAAFNSLIEVFLYNRPEVKQEYTQSDPETRKELAKKVLLLLKDKIEHPYPNDNFFFTIAMANGHNKEIKSIDLDRIPANAPNIAMWAEMTEEIKLFASGGIKDSKPIFERLHKYLENIFG